jgi:hypothetical protein
LFIVTLVYGLIMAVCDRRLEFSPLARQIAFALYIAGALVYVGLLVLRPLLQPINPYYAARRLEATIPEAKNSVVNWLDLHQQAIAPAFRSAISHQAAKDLADADLEQAISARRAGWLGTSAAVLCVCMLVLFLLGPRQFLSLMNRAFAPFVEASIATRTRLLLEQPEGGDVTIPVGKAVAFSVWVEGRVPEPSSSEALKLLYRYNPSDPYQTRLLERGDSSRQWFTNLLAPEVHNGFCYKVAGGDAETPEYRVQVRSTPLLTGFDVTYHYRPYLGWPDRTTHEQNLQDLRGTEVTLLARTNRTVKDGHLGIDNQQPFAGELVPDDPQALRFHLRLESEGNYRIWFRSVEGERNNDPMPYTIRVLQDHPPQIELTKPGEDIQLPANGLLRLEGKASDDFGITSVDLRVKIENGPVLQSKTYRKGETLRRGDGSYPQVLAYQDFVELDKLQREDNQPVALLQPGAKLEYWLEATDNCDYPGPNIGQSKHFKVTIQPPDTDQKKQEQARQDARQEQQKHDRKQDRDLQNQKRETPDKQQDQQTPPPDKDQANKDNAQPSEQELNKQKEKIEDAINKNERQTGKNGDSKGEQSQANKGEGQANPSQQSQGEGPSQRPADKDPNKDKGESGSKAQANQEKGNGKPEANREKSEQKGEGQGASQSNGQQGGDPQSQKSTERQTDQGMTEESKQQSKQAADQSKGSNQAGKSPEDRQKGTEGGQAEDRPKSKSEKGEQNNQSNNPGEKGRENPQTGKQQQPANGQEKSSKQNEGKSSTGDSPAKSPSGQGAPGEQSDHTGDQNSQQGQADRSTDATKKARSDHERGSPDSAKQPPENAREKAEKTSSGQEPVKEQAGQPKDQAKQGAKAETGEKANQGEQSENQQGGQKNEDGNAGQRPDKGQERGGAERHREKTGESQGKSRPDRREAPRQDKADGAEGTKGEAREKTDGSGREHDVKPKPSETQKRDGGESAEAKQERKENGDNPAKQGKQGADKAAEKKAGAGSEGTDKTRTQQPKPEQAGGKGTDANAKDAVSSLSEALKGRDQKGRAEARKKLEELRDKAKDPAVRQAAREALEQAGRDSGNQSQDRTNPDGKGQPDKHAPPQKGEKERGPGKGEGSEHEKPPPQQNGAGAGESNASKGENRDANQADSKRDSRPQKGERGNEAGSPKRPGGSGAAGSSGGSDPSPQKPDANGASDDQSSQEKQSREPPTAPNPAYGKRAGELQLEDIKKKVNKDVLNQLNMTEEDFQKFVKAYEDMLKRKQPAAAERNNLTGPQRGNRSLPNQRVRQVDPREQAKGGNLQRLDPSVAPPEFREAYREFSRRISELEQSKEKK